MLDWMIYHFRKWADYNSGAIIRLYDAYAVLSDAELQRDRKESFNSVCGTLNQILVGDRIGLAQFTDGVEPATDRVRELNALRSARFAEDDQIREFINGLDANFSEGKIVYVKNEARMLKDTRHPPPAHFFNHQTHRRGQVHCMLRVKQEWQRPSSIYTG